MSQGWGSHLPRQTSQMNFLTFTLNEVSPGASGLSQTHRIASQCCMAESIHLTGNQPIGFHVPPSVRGGQFPPRLLGQVQKAPSVSPAVPVCATPLALQTLRLCTRAPMPPANQAHQPPWAPFHGGPCSTNMCTYVSPTCHPCAIHILNDE